MSLSPNLTDEELLRLMIAGNEEAFTRLYRQRQSAIFRFAWQMSGSEAVAEDVTQEVFMTLMREAHKFDPARGSLSSYLYGIARHHVLRSAHSNRKFVALVDGENETEEAGAPKLLAPCDMLDDLAREQMIEKLRCAVVALPARYREAVVLCDLHEMSYEDAARVIGCALGTVRSRLHRGRALLAEKMRGAESVSASESTEADAVNLERCFG